jgi:hypothetical protein
LLYVLSQGDSVVVQIFDFALVYFVFYVLSSKIISNNNSSFYLVNAQLLYIGVIAGNGVQGFNGDNQPARATQVHLVAYGVIQKVTYTGRVGDA